MQRSTQEGEAMIERAEVVAMLKQLGVPIGDFEESLIDVTPDEIVAFANMCFSAGALHQMMKENP